MPVTCRVLIPDVLPAVMTVLPAVPEVLPAPLSALVRACPQPADLPAQGRAALAAALAGAVPRGQRPDRGKLLLAAGIARWDDAELARLRGFLRTVDEPRGRRGRM